MDRKKESKVSQDRESQPYNQFEATSAHYEGISLRAINNPLQKEEILSAKKQSMLNAAPLFPIRHIHFRFESTIARSWANAHPLSCFKPPSSLAPWFRSSSATLFHYWWNPIRNCH